ncbi:GNAT family N-acetyltransferase [Nocardioides sp.]|uniref:GNAT family N-acetyltransferase n=1 Tax=Nocardioides sp. TaxID=35761 RepID=UPI002EDA6A4A
MSHSVHLTEDPAAFLAEASGHLAADPVVATVIASVTQRLLESDQRGLPRGDHPRWWAMVRDETGAVVGVAMRTAPFAPYPVYVLPMPDDAAVQLARLVHDRGEPLAGVNGALPAARLAAEETARLAGGEVRVHEHLRLFELGGLVVPPSPPGRLRLATSADLDLTLAWFRAFGIAAAAQAGRSEAHAMPDFTPEDMLERIDKAVVWLWEDEHGERVHLTAANPPAHGVTRIGPVYTPAAHRGRGYASAAVAAVSRQYVEQGVRCCLFTDQANPTSNRIYQALGYEPVVDMVNLVITRPGPA